MFDLWPDKPVKSSHIYLVKNNANSLMFLFVMQCFHYVFLSDTNVLHTANSLIRRCLRVFAVCTAKQNFSQRVCLFIYFILFILHVYKDGYECSYK